MKINKWYKREIMERFMSIEEIVDFNEAYKDAQMVNVGRRYYEKERGINLPPTSNSRESLD